MPFVLKPERDSEWELWYEFWIVQKITFQPKNSLQSVFLGLISAQLVNPVPQKTILKSLHKLRNGYFESLFWEVWDQINSWLMSSKQINLSLGRKQLQFLSLLSKALVTTLTFIFSRVGKLYKQRYVKRRFLIFSCRIKGRLSDFQINCFKNLV